MVNPIFRGNKGEGFEVFLKEQKRICNGIGLRTIVKWFNFFLEFLKGITSHWFEQQTKTLTKSQNDITEALMKEFFMKNVYQNLILELNEKI